MLLIKTLSTLTSLKKQNSLLFGLSRTHLQVSKMENFSVSLFWIVVSNFKENSFICNLVDNNSLTTTTIVYQIVDHIHKTIQFMPTSTGFRRRLNIYSQTQLNHNYHDHKFWAYQHHCPSSCQLISLTTTIMRP